MVRMSNGRRHASVILLLVVLALAALAAMTLRTPGVSAQGTYVFGTQVQLVLYGVEQDDARRATNAVFSRLNQMHAQLHAWRPSELTRLNAALAAGVPFQASPRLADMLREAQRLSRQSGGLFDPGIGRLIRLWGFQADQFAVAPPSAQAVNALENQHASLNDLEISPSGRVSSRNPGVALDLGGYAKGWSLDEAAVILKSLGVKNALIDVGGNLLALGSKGDEPWRVGVQNPRHPGSLGTIALRDGEAIGTSGDYDRYFIAGGQRYCHILDPRNGFPAKASQSATVLIDPGAHAGALSDGASKPPFIAGAHRALSLVQALGVNKLILVDGNGAIWVSPAMAGRVTWTDPHTRVHLLGADPEPHV